eukprot:3824179-Rhodomonas_salina.2
MEDEAIKQRDDGAARACSLMVVGQQLKRLTHDNAELRAELNSARSKHEADFNSAKGEFEAGVSRLKDGQVAELSRLQGEFDARVSRLNAEHEDEVRIFQDRHDGVKELAAQTAREQDDEILRLEYEVNQNHIDLKRIKASAAAANAGHTAEAKLLRDKIKNLLAAADRAKKEYEDAIRAEEIENAIRAEEIDRLRSEISILASENDHLKDDAFMRPKLLNGVRVAAESDVGTADDGSRVRVAAESDAGTADDGSRSSDNDVVLSKPSARHLVHNKRRRDWLDEEEEEEEEEPGLPRSRVADSLAAASPDAPHLDFESGRYDEPPPGDDEETFNDKEEMLQKASSEAPAAVSPATAATKPRKGSKPKGLKRTRKVIVPQTPDPKPQRSRCPHNRQRSKCVQCGGSGVCEHKHLRTTCLACKDAGTGGSMICDNHIRRAGCKECGGSAICEHGRQKVKCPLC